MIDITFDIVTGIAALVSPVRFKAGADVPVRVTCSANPGTLAAGAMELAIGTYEIQPQTLAYNASFTQATAVFTATLDADDSRLVDFMEERGPEPVNADLLIELVVTISGKRLIAPSLLCIVEPPVLYGAGSSSSGPIFLRLETTVTSLTDDGANSLEYRDTFGANADNLVGDYICIDVASGTYPGIRCYRLITAAEAVTKYGSSDENLPGIVRPLDFGSSSLVWEERL